MGAAVLQGRNQHRQHLAGLPLQRHPAGGQGQDEEGPVHGGGEIVQDGQPFVQVAVEELQFFGLKITRRPRWGGPGAHQGDEGRPDRFRGRGEVEFDALRGEQLLDLHGVILI